MWAFRKGFLATRTRERWDDVVSVFSSKRGDHANGLLIRLLASHPGYAEVDPYDLSFLDDLDALRDSATVILGGPPPNTLLQSILAKDSFAVELFGLFIRPHAELRKALEHLRGALLTGRRVEVFELARAVKEGCRLVVQTEAVGSERLQALMEVVRVVAQGHLPGDRAMSELVKAQALFTAAFQNLRRYAHEMYPVLLKLTGSFYEEEDREPEKRRRFLQFLALREDEILSWEGWQQRLKELRERALKERQEREEEQKEKDKTEVFTVRFQAPLATLSELLPESGIQRMDQGEFLLPFFTNRIFSRRPLFQARLPDLERMAATDVMGLILVLHAMLDDLLSVVEPYAVEKLTGAEGTAQALIALRGQWQEAYTKLFEPYLDEIREYALELEGDPRFARRFRESQRARTIEERINQLRNRAIKGFGHLISGREHYDGPKLFELAERLVKLAAELEEAVDPNTPRLPRRPGDDQDGLDVVNLAASSRTGSPQYRPLARRIRRWIESRVGESVAEDPEKAQASFFEVLRGMAGVYNFLLNDPKSFAASTAHTVSLGGTEERERWAQERGAVDRESLLTVQSLLREDIPGQNVDRLTGLKSREYLRNELPRHFSEFRAQGKRIALLMLNIDHLSWVNDRLGDDREDRLLKTAAGLVLDNIREGDIAIRCEGEEMLVVFGGDLHAGITLGERLRQAQERGLKHGDSMKDVLGIAEAEKDPCGTFSIGVIDATAIPELAPALDRVKQSLHHAKRTRNTVVYFDPARAGQGLEPFSSFAEYRQARQAPVPPSRGAHAASRPAVSAALEKPGSTT